MAEPTFTREAWRRLTCSEFGLTALDGTLGDLQGIGRLGVAAQPRGLGKGMELRNGRGLKAHG